MKWPWTRTPENRGTLTLLPNDEFLLGMPHGTTDEQVYRVSQGIREWIDSGRTKLLVLPFPVDIVDRRPDQRLPLLLPNYHALERPLEHIAVTLDRIDRKTAKRRPRIIVCEHEAQFPDWGKT